MNGTVTIIDDRHAEYLHTRQQRRLLRDGGIQRYTLTPLGGGGFLLREADGTITAFGANGKVTYIQDTNGNTVTASYTNGLLTSLTACRGPEPHIDLQ